MKHYLIDIIDPDMEYSVKDFKEQYIKAKEEIQKQNKHIVVVGGTGLYINSIVYDLNFLESNNLKFRKEATEKIKEDKNYLPKLYKNLQEIDPEYASKISVTDEKRIIRAFEIYLSTGKTKTEIDRLQRETNKDEDIYFLFVLDMPREKLYRQNK